MMSEEELLLREGLILKEMDLLKQELSLVYAKLEFHRKFKTSVKQQKEESPPCLTSTSEIKEILSPVLREKDKTSPVQTETGKDKSIPLKVDALPKSIAEVQTSRTLVTPLDFINLRPNGGIQIPQDGVKSDDGQMSKTGFQIPDKNSKPFYVVFNGANKGIFENWEIAKKATEGISHVKHKRFNNLLEARTAANLYCRENFLEENSIQLITSAETLRPNTFVKALKSRANNKTILGRLPSSTPKTKIVLEKEIQQPPLTVETFEYLQKHAKNADEKNLIEEKFFTKDSKEFSQFNFIKGADPEMVAETFSYGMVKTIYPSQNLLEIRLLPKTLYKTVKDFRTKVLKTEKDIFLKIHSSLPIWVDEKLSYSPQHIVQVGICGKENYTPSVPMVYNDLGHEELLSLGKKKLNEFLQLTFSFTIDDRLFIIHESRDYLVYTKGSRKLGTLDEQRILEFQTKFAQGTYISQHDGRLCSIINKWTAVPCESCKEDGIRVKSKDSPPKDEASTSQKAKDDSIMDLLL